MKHIAGKALIAAILIIGISSWWSSAPSEKNMCALLIQRQDELSEFISLARSEAMRGHDDCRPEPDVQMLLRPESTYFRAIYQNEDGSLEGRLLDWNLFDPDTAAVSAQLQSTWTQLCKGEMTGIDMSCRFTESGALQARFFRAGKWVRYEEGYYRHNHCLIFQDDDYPEPPDAYWRVLTEEDGVAPSAGGAWYYAYEKQYDG